MNRDKLKKIREALKSCNIKSYKYRADDQSGIFELTKEVFWFDRRKVKEALGIVEALLKF